MNREELAWAAGFFDGEGHVGFSMRKTRPRIDGSVAGHPVVAVGQAERAILQRFRDAVGFGVTVGPYHRHAKSQRKPMFYYRCSRFEYVQALVAMLWTWLSPTKRDQAADALRRYRTQGDGRKLRWNFRK